MAEASESEWRLSAPLEVCPVGLKHMKPDTVCFYHTITHAGFDLILHCKLSKIRETRNTRVEKRLGDLELGVLHALFRDPCYKGALESPS